VGSSVRRGSIATYREIIEDAFLQANKEIEVKRMLSTPLIAVIISGGSRAARMTFGWGKRPVSPVSHLSRTTMYLYPISVPWSKDTVIPRGHVDGTQLPQQSTVI